MWNRSKYAAYCTCCTQQAPLPSCKFAVCKRLRNKHATSEQPAVQNRDNRFLNVESLQGFSHSAYFSREIRLSAVPIQAVATILPRELSSIPSHCGGKEGTVLQFAAASTTDLRRLVAIVVSQPQP